MQSFQLESSTATAEPASYSLQDWQKGYRSLPQEYDYWIDEIEGEIPAGLHGTLFRNGPGLLDINGQRIHHPFDGDGMISAISFTGEGRAHFRNRYVKTQGYLEEQQAGKILYRGVFGTQKPGGWLANALDMRLKNIANTHVIYWGGKLWALWEAAEPHQLDPQTLETLGIDYLDGLLQPGSPFAAHPRIDPDHAIHHQPCLVNFAVKTGLSSSITLYEFAPDGSLLHQSSHAIPGFAFMHDFAITPNYGIFFQAPMGLNPFPFLLGMRTAGQCLQVRKGQPTQAIIIPRGGDAPVQLIPIEAGFVFHHANAFEQDGSLYVDSICYESLPAVDPDEDYREVRFNQLAPGQLWRFRFDLKTQTVEQQLIISRCCEFPTMHPRQVGRPYRYLYLGAADAPTGNAPLQAILKYDWQTGEQQVWSAAPRGFVSEPIFVPRSADAQAAEDDGWLLTMVFNAERERSELVILDAKTMQPVTKLRLKHHIPYGLHGSFTAECFIG